VLGESTKVSGYIVFNSVPLVLINTVAPGSKIVETVVPMVLTQLIDPPGLVPVMALTGCKILIRILFDALDGVMDADKPVSA